MKNKKMIVVDLDGTLLNIKGKCSKKTKSYLRKLKDLGYIIVIATGRVLRSAFDVTDGAEFANYIIASSGALIYDMQYRKVIYKNSLSKLDNIGIDKIDIDSIDFVNVCDLFYHNRVMGNRCLTSRYERYVNDINKIDNEIFHITVKFKNNDLTYKYYQILKKNKNLEVIVMQDSFTDRKWIEIFKKGVSKFNAIKIIMERENIRSSDVIAFGDGLNDIDMLKNSFVGVAMENALDLVKEASDYITISHNDDGVVYFLRNYFKENDLIN